MRPILVLLLALSACAAPYKRLANGDALLSRDSANRRCVSRSADVGDGRATLYFDRDGDRCVASVEVAEFSAADGLQLPIFGGCRPENLFSDEDFFVGACCGSFGLDLDPRAGRYRAVDSWRDEMLRDLPPGELVALLPAGSGFGLFATRLPDVHVVATGDPSNPDNVHGLARVLDPRGLRTAAEAARRVHETCGQPNRPRYANLVRSAPGAFADAFDRALLDLVLPRLRDTADRHVAGSLDQRLAAAFEVAMEAGCAGPVLASPDRRNELGLAASKTLGSLFPAEGSEGEGFVAAWQIDPPARADRGGSPLDLGGSAADKAEAWFAQWRAMAPEARLAMLLAAGSPTPLGGAPASTFEHAVTRALAPALVGDWRPLLDARARTYDARGLTVTAAVISLATGLRVADQPTLEAGRQVLARAVAPHRPAVAAGPVLRGLFDDGLFDATTGAWLGPVSRFVPGDAPVKPEVLFECTEPTYTETSHRDVSRTPLTRTVRETRDQETTPQQRADLERVHDRIEALDAQIAMMEANRPAVTEAPRGLVGYSCDKRNRCSPVYQGGGESGSSAWIRGSYNSALSELGLRRAGLLDQAAALTPGRYEVEREVDDGYRTSFVDSVTGRSSAMLTTQGPTGANREEVVASRRLLASQAKVLSSTLRDELVRSLRRRVLETATTQVAPAIRAHLASLPPGTTASDRAREEAWLRRLLLDDRSSDNRRALGDESELLP